MSAGQIHGIFDEIVSQRIEDTASDESPYWADEFPKASRNVEGVTDFIWARWRPKENTRAAKKTYEAFAMTNSRFLAPISMASQQFSRAKMALAAQDSCHRGGSREEDRCTVADDDWDCGGSHLAWLFRGLGQPPWTGSTATSSWRSAVRPTCSKQSFVLGFGFAGGLASESCAGSGAGD